MRRTGVIVGTNTHVTREEAEDALKELRRQFPGVEFAMVSGASSVAFEFEGSPLDAIRPSPSDGFPYG